MRRKPLEVRGGLSGLQVQDSVWLALYLYPIGTAFQPYTVRVSTNCLRIRKGPGTNYGSRGFTGRGVFTIVAEATGKGASKWSLLKSYAGKRDGWISLDYAKKL